jgi:hypothetical protein
MRDFLKASGRFVSVGWFWVGVLLVLPNCSFHPGFVGPGDNLSKGAAPHSSAIFCDIEASRHCSTAEERGMGIRLASAAVALNKGDSNPIGLDDSPAALARCGGVAEAVVFRGAFPEGFGVCLNCGDVIGTATYPDVNTACVAQCEDFVGTTASDGTIIPENPPSADTAAYCGSHAKASTNFPNDGCFAGACTTAGALDTAFPDPRRVPEPITWGDLVGVTAAGNTLTRSAASSGQWDAGGASTALITQGDGYVEFVVAETNLARMGGLSSGAPPDTNQSFLTIGFGIDLFSDGIFRVFENGVLISTFTSYNVGDRFRVKVKDNFNGTATISYAHLTSACAPGAACDDAPFFTSATPGAYPFRVDSSFFDQGATLTDVRVVRIH